MNSVFTSKLLPVLNPTLHVQLRDVKNIPLPNSSPNYTIIKKIITCLVGLTKSDWDNYETSWDFSDFPLLREHGPWPFSDDRKDPEIVFRSSENQAIKGKTLAESWENWKAFSQAMISRMKELEEENNRIWIEAYGLQDELSPEVPLKEITLTCNPWYRYSSDNKSENQLWKLARADSARELLSYAVGCMMGRYSLDKPGLILANQGEGVEEYLKKIGVGGAELGREVEHRTSNVEPRTSKDSSQMDLFADHSALRTPHSAFLPDDDGILPVLDGEWFADDVVARTREFLRVCWGKERMTENLHWLEEALGKDLRSYFVDDFYGDHISGDRAYGYKKRPIYWLFQSPKKGFGALVYLHRYNRDTVNTLLNRYLRPYLGKLEDRIRALDHDQATASGSALTAARKEQESLRKTLKECQDWEREVLFPLAQKRIELDLDDGVKTNYPKFGKALAKVPGLEE